jgi:hypothetical protein
MRNKERRETRIALFLFNLDDFAQAMAARAPRLPLPADHWLLRAGEPAQYEFVRIGGRYPG